MKPEILIGGLVATVAFAILAMRVERRSPQEALATFAPALVGVFGVFVVASMPTDLQLPVVVLIVITAFALLVARGIVRAGRE